MIKVERMEVTSSPNPRSWGVAEVCGWGHSCGYPKDVLNALLKNEIDGKTLLTLSVQDLREELKISSLKDRRRLAADINALIGYDRVRYQTIALKELRESTNLLSNNRDDIQDNDPIDLALKFQAEEIMLHEMFLSDHLMAAKEQEHYSKQLLISESDMIIARTVGNVTDLTAAARLVEANERVKANRDCSNHEFSALINGQNFKDGVSEQKDQTIDETDDQYTFMTPDKDALCISCQGDFKSSDVIYAVTNTCGHSYCKGCCKRWFADALGDKTLIPIRCCNLALPLPLILKLASEIMSKDSLQKLQTRHEEVSATNKMYCPSPVCATFINLDKIESYVDDDMTFACVNPDCRLRICYTCKTPSHGPTISCEQNLAHVAAVQAGNVLDYKALGLQKCSKCTAIVELIVGCNHMTCRCNHEFCYLCGADWVPRRCQCVVADINRIILDEEQNIPYHIVGHERQAIVRQRAQAAYNDMLAEEECAHRMYRRREGYDEITNYRRRPKCNLCNRRLNIFGYQCTTCPRMVCIGCRYNR